MVSIIWHGHSNFQIFYKEKSILIDPFFTNNPKAVCSWQEIEKPNLLLITHNHADHLGDAVDISKKFGCMVGVAVGVGEQLIKDGVRTEQVINTIGFNIGGTIAFQDISITMVEALHTTDSVAAVGYIIKLDNGFTIYHAGDTGISANMQIWGELYSIDLALLPIGGVFTMDARQAALAAKLLQAKRAIPMHWGTFPALSQNPDSFIKELNTVAPNCRYVAMPIGQKVHIN